MIDVALLIIVAVVTWCVASEGAWGAATMLITVILSGLLAMNFFEPLANFLQTNAGPTWGARFDILALLGLFIGFVFALRSLMEYLIPTFIQVHPVAYEGVRWVCAAVTGYVTMAILLTALHTAPLPREFLGFTAERDNFLMLTAPDRQWLGFTQYVSERVFPGARIFDGPRFTVGNYPNDTWPSFPIRYATRREMLETGGVASSAPPPPARRRPPPTGGNPGF